MGSRRAGRQRAQAGVAFIVELGANLSPDEARMHADAVLTIAAEST